jgi:hypothetical protein
VCEIRASGGATAVASLDLVQNSLRGRVPEENARLAHMKELFLYGNDLSGMLPDAMIQRWLSGTLWVNAEAAQLTKVTEIDYQDSCSSVLCAQHRVMLPLGLERHALHGALSK